jgi:hypothetical protein
MGRRRTIYAKASLRDEPRANLLSSSENDLRLSGSYPSGHAAIGWTWALISSVISPDGHKGHKAGHQNSFTPLALRANRRSILVAMMKSFSCSPLIFLVCRETVAMPQPKLIFG